MTDAESQEDEIEALQSIFTNEEFYSLKENNAIKGQFNAFVSVPEGFTVVYTHFKFYNDKTSSNNSSEKTTENEVSEKTSENEVSEKTSENEVSEKTSENEVSEKTTENEVSEKTTENEVSEKAMNVQYLPPVQLNFELPSDYPSKSPPFYVITCPWLTFYQLEKLSKQLYGIWNENKGFVVLYSWAQFLKDECLTFLKLDKSLDLSRVERSNRVRLKIIDNKKMKRRQRYKKVSEVQAGNDITGEGASKTKGEKFSVVDLSSVSDKVKDEQTLLVKLSLYDSNPTGNSERSEATNVKQAEKKTSGTAKKVNNEMIAFDQTVDVKRSPYCTGSSGNASRDAKFDKDIEVEAGPSGRRNWFLRNRRTRRPRPFKEKKVPYRLEVTYLSEPLWNTIVDYNKMRKRKDFDYQIFCCAVCFEEKIGSQCMELESCNHVFCRECLTSFLNVCITEGNVKQLSCPETDCDTELLQSEIRSLVSPELFTKYDSLLLATTLDTLNVMYCPRKFCQYPVSCDNETMALCPQCQYCFCPFCKMVYHGVEPCRFKLDSEETKALIKEYQNCSEAKKAELEKRYGRKHLQQLVDTSLSQSWLTSNSKQCPKCNSSIEKTYGCNKMVCLRCHTAFCWLCFKILDSIDPYHHFKVGRCAGKLYLGMTIEDDDALDELDVDDDFEDDDDDILFDDDDFLHQADFEYFGLNVGMRPYHNGIFYL